jgi:hypothetical protein
MPKLNSKQQMLDLGLNAWAFELTAESYRNTIARLGEMPEVAKKVEVYMKGCKITVEPLKDEEKEFDLYADWKPKA